MTDFERRSTGLFHSTDELRRLIIENPYLPIIVFAGECANNDYYSFASCSCVNAYKGEFLDCMQTINDDRCFTDRDDFRKALEDHFADCGNFTYKEFDTLIEKQLAEYEPYWKPCICLYVDN